MGATWKACKHIFSGIKYNYIDVWPSPPSTSRNSSSFPPEILFPLSISLSSSPGPVSMNLTSLGILYKRNHTVSFHDWLISLSIVPSRYSCVIAGARNFFLSKAKYYSTVWMEFFLSILDKCCVYLSVVTQVASMFFLAIVNDAAMNTGPQVSLLNYVSLQASGNIKYDVYKGHASPPTYTCTHTTDLSACVTFFSASCKNLFIGISSAQHYKGCQHWSLILVRPYKSHDFQRVHSTVFTIKNKSVLSML